MKHELTILSLGAVFSFIACGNGGPSLTSGTTGTHATVGSSSATTSSSTGMGGMTSSSTASDTTTTTTTTTTGSGASGPAGGHLLISEIGVAPAGGEFIELYNPKTGSEDLSPYLLSDNAAYYGVALGMPWNPSTQTPGSDFLLGFPLGDLLDPGATIVIATSPEFETVYGRCPDYILDTTPLNCKNGTAKAMVAPANGGAGTKPGALLSDDYEMVVLFQWDGAKQVIADLDYVTWGAMTDPASRVDKTQVIGYVPDTPIANQKPAPAPPAGQSIERCDVTEPGEKNMGGNGVDGDDETSEPLNVNFKVQAKPTPGLKNDCIP